MHPALSIIAFTVLSGLGFGWVLVSILLDATGIAPFTGDGHRLGSGVVAGIVIVVGLVCSTGHLANPRNAWRSLTRLRTSWLSREALLALLFLPLYGAYLLAVWRAPESAAVTAFGAASALLALATVLCTAMIYACLRTIRQWNTPLTPVNFLAIALSLGALCHLLSLAIAAPADAPLSLGAGSTVALVLIVIAFAGKLGFFLSMGLPPSRSIEVATGLKMATVRLLDVGHTAGTFLTDEFDYRVSRGLLVALRIAALLLGFALPALLVAGSASVATLGFALVLGLAGALIERWLFFAEAQHVVRLYHGQRAT